MHGRISFQKQTSLHSLELDFPQTTRSRREGWQRWHMSEFPIFRVPAKWNSFLKRRANSEDRELTSPTGYSARGSLISKPRDQIPKSSYWCDGQPSRRRGVWETYPSCHRRRRRRGKARRLYGLLTKAQVRVLLILRFRLLFWYFPKSWSPCVEITIFWFPQIMWYVLCILGS